MSTSEWLSNTFEIFSDTNSVAKCGSHISRFKHDALDTVRCSLSHQITWTTGKCHSTCTCSIQTGTMHSMPISICGIPHDRHRHVETACITRACMYQGVSISRQNSGILQWLLLRDKRSVKRNRSRLSRLPCPHFYVGGYVLKQWENVLMFNVWRNRHRSEGRT